ncbi:uncharacterized protein LOC128393654 [Panonychus citri]|uniref:uncharacterized protein LOC128393654 n=1 Tax=Panonychus citri TaxID=50023 RepID=UPI00230776D1|nr:uncharacterized protein LOC128393654 [Panonychus citri]
MEMLPLPKYEIVNIVSLWNIDPVVINVDNTNRRKKFNAEVIRRKEGVFLVFASGKVTATGFTDVSTAGAVLQEVYPERTVSFLRVVNITAHSFINYSFNTKMMIDTYADTTYEPEIYPAVYIKINKVTLIYYTTGSLIITGAKDQEQIESTLREFTNRTLTHS